MPESQVSEDSTRILRDLALVFMRISLASEEQTDGVD